MKIHSVRHLSRQWIVRIVIVLGILVFLNILGLRYFTRLDLTENKIFTLSSASKSLVKSLDDRLVVKAYFSSDLPPQYSNNRQYLKDQLDEYRAYGGGNFQYEFIDPSKNEELEREAQRYGIPPVQAQALVKDKFQVVKAYMGLVMLYGDKQERIPVLENTENLEYELSSAIKRLSVKELQKIGFLSGHGEPTLQQLGAMQGILAKQYQVVTVDLAGGRAVPDDIAVLMMVAPTTPLKNWEKFLIDQFIMRGGRAGLLLNKVSITLEGQTGKPIDVGLDDLLESYGLRVNTDLVRDASCAYVTISQRTGFGMMQSQVPFPFLPSASSFDEVSPVVKGLKSVVFYFTSSIDTSLARSKGFKADVLVRSSRKSGRQENVFVVNPTTPLTEEMFSESGIPLVVSVEGTFVSAFGNKSVGADSGARGGIDTTRKLISAIRPTKIVVAGDGDFLQDQYSGNQRDNFLLASNLIDYLADDIGLAEIRTKNSDPKPLEEVSDGTRVWIKGINLALPPLLVAVAGVARWRWRAARRKRIEVRSL